MDFLGIGIGLPQIALVLLVAMLVLGPERMPEVARQLAKWVKVLRGYASDVQGQFEGEIGVIREEFIGIQQDLDAVRGNLRGGLAELDSTLRSVDAEVRSVSGDVNGAVQSATPAAGAVPEYAPKVPTPLRPVPNSSAFSVEPAAASSAGDGSRLPDYRPPA